MSLSKFTSGWESLFDLMSTFAPVRRLALLPIQSSTNMIVRRLGMALTDLAVRRSGHDFRQVEHKPRTCSLCDTPAAFEWRQRDDDASGEWDLTP
jgi:hypothetical protein